jgi:hypothetical protein
MCSLILKHFPMLVLLRNPIFGLNCAKTVPKLLH